jgi:SAM-dependent methyltransferase
MSRRPEGLVLPGGPGREEPGARLPAAATGPGGVIAASARRAARIARNAVLDLRYGRPLGGTVRTRYAHLGAFDTANSSYEDLPALFAAAGLGVGDVVVDIGCGKGRVLNWLLRHYPGTPLVGIELDSGIAAQTRRRLRRYPAVRVVCGDAATELPAEASVFYLFNPFDESVVARFAGTLRALEPLADGRARRIVYCRCKFLGPFEQSDRFAIEPVELPAGSHRAALITLLPLAAPAGEPAVLSPGSPA